MTPNRNYACIIRALKLALQNTTGADRDIVVGGIKSMIELLGSTATSSNNLRAALDHIAHDDNHGALSYIQNAIDILDLNGRA